MISSDALEVSPNFGAMLDASEHIRRVIVT
jgi:hypothetical protein